MSKSQYGLSVAILLIVTNLTTASIVYGLLYSVPAAAQVSSSPANSEPNLPKPELKIPAQTEQSAAVPQDPLKVLDYDNAPGPHSPYEVRLLKSKWQLAGVTLVHVEGSPQGEVVMVCFFKGNPRFYREGDRLEETHFTVKHLHSEKDKTYVEVEGDLGIRVKLHQFNEDRYK